MSQSVMVLGASGMLGSMVLDVLSRESNLLVSATVRSEVQRSAGRHRYPHVRWSIYDAEAPEVEIRSGYVASHDWVVNCIGITKPLIDPKKPTSVERAIRVNALWSHQLARAVSDARHRLLQIATDCVYSGHEGPYAEFDPPDARDAYGHTKSLGETAYPGVTNLRTSIIGPEDGPSKFLLEWVKRQPKGAELRGFTNHWWNGVTTLQFAEICRGIIQVRPTLGSLVHVVPRDIVNKYQLVQRIAMAYGRNDLLIEPFDSPRTNMTLATHQPEVVERLWAAAGYDEVPTIEQMVTTLATRSLVQV